MTHFHMSVQLHQLEWFNNLQRAQKNTNELQL